MLTLTSFEVEVIKRVCPAQIVLGGPGFNYFGQDWLAIWTWIMGSVAKLSVFSNGEPKLDPQDIPGIVGISCPLTNVSGGWETKTMGLPAQGLLLDYCGCPWHWELDSQGFPTAINLRQLLKLIGQESVPAQSFITSTSACSPSR
ncbi:MAG: hypothetical protein JXA13_11090 [Anaerolineales bacterium]|nr:hypothetical protein [Anaerolineales bacterium]